MRWMFNKQFAQLSYVMARRGYINWND